MVVYYSIRYAHTRLIIKIVSVQKNRDNDKIKQENILNYFKNVQFYLLCKKKKKIIIMYFSRLYYITNSILWGCILPLTSYIIICI